MKNAKKKNASPKKTLHGIVGEILKKNKKKQLTAHQLADLIVKTEPEFCAKKTKKTGKTEKVLTFQLMSEIGAQFYAIQQHDIARTDDRPAKYYYKAPAKKAAK